MKNLYKISVNFELLTEKPKRNQHLMDWFGNVYQASYIDNRVEMEMICPWDVIFNDSAQVEAKENEEPVFEFAKGKPHCVKAIKNYYTTHVINSRSRGQKVY